MEYKYTNVPPKEIYSAIRLSCFDLDKCDHDDVVAGETVQNRTYEAWQGVSQVLKGWAAADPEGFLKYIKDLKPEINEG